VPLALRRPAVTGGAFLGIDRPIPMTHGSQGCTAFGKVFFSFDPYAIQSSGTNFSYEHNFRSRPIGLNTRMDDLVLSTVVPEPAAGALVLGAVGVLGLVRKRAS